MVTEADRGVSRVFTPYGWLRLNAGTSDGTVTHTGHIGVYDSAPSRDAALLNPVEGEYTYLRDSDQLEFYDGATWKAQHPTTGGGGGAGSTEGIWEYQGTDAQIDPGSGNVTREQQGNEWLFAFSDTDADGNKRNLSVLLPGDNLTMSDDPLTPPVTNFSRYAVVEDPVDRGNWYQVRTLRTDNRGSKPPVGTRVRVLATFGAGSGGAHYYSETEPVGSFIPGDVWFRPPGQAAPVIPVPALPYREEVLADSPMAYWEFDEAPGAVVALDSSGNGLHGTVVNNGALTFGVQGRVGTAVSASGPTDGSRILVGDGDVFGVLSELTIEMWVLYSDLTPGDTGSDWLPFMCGGYTSANVDKRNFYVNTAVGDGLAYVTCRLGQNPARAYGGANYVVGKTWHHVVHTVHAPSREVKTYIDGVLAGTDTHQFSGSIPADPEEPTTILGWTQKNTLGNPGEKLFPGTLDDLVIYDHVLSENRVQAHYAAGIFAAPVAPYRDELDNSGAMAHYELDEAAGSTVASDRLGGVGALTAAGPSVTFGEDGTVNTAVGFSGAGLADGTDLGTATSSEALSIAAWVICPTSAAVADHAVAVDGTNVGADNRNYALVVRGADGFVARGEFRAGASSVEFVQGVTPLNDGAWHHVALVRDWSVLSLYVDGALEAQSNVTSDNSASWLAGGFHLGKDWDDLVGDLTVDEVALYEGVLTPGDIERQYAAGWSPAGEALFVYMRVWTGSLWVPVADETP